MFACQFNESMEVLLFILSDIKTAKINCCATLLYPNLRVWMP